jgi:hypothetical protein
MKAFSIILILCFVLTLTGFAQQSADLPASKQDVERYLAAMHAHDMMKNMVNAMSTPMHKMIHEQYLKDKNKLPPDFEARMNGIMDDMLKDMPWDDMIDAMVPAYQKHFTKGDIDALVTFYSSPTGQKILRELPAVTAEAMDTMMPIMQKYMERTTQRMQAQVAEMTRESQEKAERVPHKN